MNYEIARYRPELRPGVVALLRHLVSRDDDLNDAYFNWKHEANPYTREPLVYVALADGVVVGMRAFQGARWQIGADRMEVFWPCACDFVVAPEHRGNKFFRSIMDFAIADLAEMGTGTLLNWSASPVTYGASLRAGWRLVGAYDVYARQTVRTRHVRRLSNRIRRLPLAWRFADVPVSLFLRPGFDALDAAWARSTTSVTLSIEKLPRPEEMADLVCRTTTVRVAHARDAIYFRWRFGNPLSEYRFVLYRAPELQGFLVLRVARLGDSADVSVVEWAAATPAIFESLLASVVERGGYDRLSVWSSALESGSMARLGEWGFTPDDGARGLRDYRPGLLAKGTREVEFGIADPVAAAQLAGFDCWDLRPLYSDFY